MNNDSNSSEDAPTFEASLAVLETIVHDLEDGQLGLGEALARYEQGVKHLKHCYELLTAAEKKIELLTGVGENGIAQTEPFEESSEPLAESAGRRRRARPARPSTNASGPPINDDVSEGDIDA